jgi:uncharacterized protein YggE
MKMRRSLSVFALLFLATAVLAQDELRTITVIGTGSSSVAPDRASVQMSIVASSATVAAAQQAAAAVTAKVLEMTSGLGIDRDRIDTTGASVRPDYRWNREREEQELRGYIAERQMRVDIRDLEKLGALVEGAVEAGVNQVSPPQLDSSKRRDAYREALDAAARDAQANAAQLAKSLGAKLGDVLQISTFSQPAPPMPIMRATMADAMEVAAPETYNAGNLNFEATITAVFELE